MQAVTAADAGPQDAVAAPAPNLRKAWAAVWILLIFHTLSFMDRSILTLLVAPIQEDLGLSDVQLGLLQGFAFAILFAVVGLPLGWLVDRFPRRLIIFAGVIFWSISTMSCGLARSFGTLFLGRAGVGGGEAALSPAAFSLMADLFPREKLAAANGLYYFGSNLGSAISLVLGGFIISALTRHGGVVLPAAGHLQPWQATFLIVGAPGMVLAFLIFVIGEPPRKAAARAAGDVGEFGAFLWRRRAVLWRHFLGFPLLAIAIYASHGWTAVYMVRQHHWDPAAIGLFLGVGVGLLGGLANVMFGRIADGMFARGRKDAYFRIHVATTAIALPLIYLAFTSAKVWVFVVLFCIGHSFLTGFGGPAMATLQVLAPDRLRGRLVALYLLVLTLIGSVLGPLLTALVTEHLFNDRAKVGYSVLLVMVTAASLGALNLAFGMKALRHAVLETEAGRAQAEAA